jgi:thiol-disulfide isomerase/thioredoxin
MRRLVLAALVLLCIWGASRQMVQRVFAGPYPAPVSKQLYAADFRESAAPSLGAVQWITPVPDAAGKVILIDFWATWCGPCRAAIPELNAIQARFKNDLVVVGLSDESPETIRAFRRQVRMDYAVATDPARGMKRALGVQGIPNVFILSTDGVVRWQGIPMDPEELLTGKVVQAVIDNDPGVARRWEGERGKE